MKVLIINGSPHKRNTWELAKLIRDRIGAVSPEAEFEEIHLKDLNLPFCLGCSACFRKGQSFCPHNEIMQPVIDKIDESDGIIFAVTTFNMQPTALFKNFMDHLCFMQHRPHFFEKKALIVSTTGGVGAKSTVKYVAGTLISMGFNKCFVLPVASNSWNSYIPPEKVRQKCTRLALKFHRDVASHKLHAPSFTAVLVYNLFRGMSLGYTKGTEYPTQDGIYWTEPARARRAYDAAVPLPPHKSAFGQLFYAIGKMGAKLTTITYAK